jgi:hypothetical protein
MGETDQPVALSRIFAEARPNIEIRQTLLSPFGMVSSAKKVVPSGNHEVIHHVAFGSTGFGVEIVSRAWLTIRRNGGHLAQE